MDYHKQRVSRHASPKAARSYFVSTKKVLGLKEDVSGFRVSNQFGSPVDDSAGKIQPAQGAVKTNILTNKLLSTGPV